MAARRAVVAAAIAAMTIPTLLWIAAAALYANPAERFEISTYVAAGVRVWIPLVSAVIIAFSVSMFALTTIRPASARLAWSGVFGLAAANAVVLLSPYLRGYEAYGRSDIMVHVGLIKDVMAGRAWLGNPYPLVHLVWAFLASLTRIEPDVLIRLAPLGAYLVYWGGLYLLSGEVFKDDRGRLLALLIGMPLLFSEFSIQLLPLASGQVAIPSMVYLWHIAHRGARPAARLLWLLTSLLAPLVHPLFAFYVAGALAFGAAAMLPRIIEQRTNADRSARLSPAPSGAWFRWPSALMAAVALLLWLWHVASAWDRAVQQGAAVLEAPHEFSSLAADYRQIHTASMTPVDGLVIGVSMYGHIVLYASAAAMVAVRLVMDGRGGKAPSPLLGVAYWYLGLCLAGAIGLASGLGSQRSLLAPVGLSPVLLAAFIRDSRLGARIHVRMRVMIISTLAVVAHVASMFAYFPDPYTHRVNSHVTAAESEGMRWFIESEYAHPVRTPTWRMRQFSAYHFGAQLEAERLGIRPGTPDGEQAAPDHFRWELARECAHSRRLSVVTSSYDRAYHLGVFRSAGRFTEDDFKALSEMTGVSHVYTNGDVDVFIVDITCPDS